MIECKLIPRKWGNSLGAVFPEEIVKKMKMKPGKPVRALLQEGKTVRVKDIFGMLKDWKKPTEQIVREGREELDSKFIR